MKVIKRFRDKNTKKIYDPKNKNSNKYEGTAERIKELQELGYLEKPKKKSNKEDK